MSAEKKFWGIVLRALKMMEMALAEYVETLQ